MNETIKTKPPVLPRKGRSTPTGITGEAEKTILSRKNKAAIQSEENAVEVEKTPRQNADKSASQEISRLAKELDKVFNPNNFKGIVRAPADLMLAASGRKIWDIPDKEIEALAETGSMCARSFVKTDPKWIALILFSMSLMTTYGGRAALHYKEVRTEKVNKALRVDKAKE